MIVGRKSQVEMTTSPPAFWKRGGVRGGKEGRGGGKYISPPSFRRYPVLSLFRTAFRSGEKKVKDHKALGFFIPRREGGTHRLDLWKVGVSMGKKANPLHIE